MHAAPAPAHVQAEYDALRRARPSRLAALSSCTLYVLPARLMRHYGGAAVLLRWTCIGPDVVHAPPAIRQALLAHEYGHVVRGHGLAAMVCFALLVAYAVSPSPAWSIALLAMALPIIAWLNRPNRELEADDEALAAVDPSTLAAAIQWALEHHKPGRPSRLATRRITRLAAPRSGWRVPP